MLLLIEKYYSGRSEYGISHVFQNLVPPLREAGVDVRYLYADLIESAEEFETLLFRALEGEDQLWVSHVGNPYLTRDVLKRVQRLGVHTVPLFWDAVDLVARERRYRVYQKHYWYKASLARQHRLLAFADAVVSFDWDLTELCPNALFFPTPQPGQVYFPAAANGKTIEVSALGSVHKGDRPAWVAAWPDMVVAGGEAGQRLGLETYADLLRSSKLSLNVPAVRDGRDQLNGRSFEILWSRTALLQPVGPNICRFLEPGKEFIPLDGPSDLPGKIRYYLEHEEEREEIAYRGWRRATTEYTGTRLWEKVQGRLALGR